MNSKIERIKEIAANLQALYPGHPVSISIHPYPRIPTVVNVHDYNYAQATELHREHGIGERVKDINESYRTLDGETDGVKLIVFMTELPPTCHKEKYIEKIPVEKTVQTGEFIEVERERIVCTGAEGGAK